jgi:hypothetical protein
MDEEDDYEKIGDRSRRLVLRASPATSSRTGTLLPETRVRTFPFQRRNGKRTCVLFPITTSPDQHALPEAFEASLNRDCLPRAPLIYGHQFEH